jgi:hypothetical protein
MATVSCESCARDELPDCPASQRDCGHHCAHSWSHDRCCWCGTEWGEGGAIIPPDARTTPILKRADIALWRLPRVARKVVVSPLAFVCGIAEAWENGARDFRYGWRAIMDEVEERPDA